MKASGSFGPFLRACGVVVLVGVLPGCLNLGGRETLSDLHGRSPDLEDSAIDDGLSQAMDGYRKFLEEAPESALTPEAMRRLADLQLERAYGAVSRPSPSGAEPNALPRPDTGGSHPQMAHDTPPTPIVGPGADAGLEDQESRAEFERRASEVPVIPLRAAASESGTAEAFEGLGVAPSPDSGPREALALYDRILETYPDYVHADQVLYQKARAFDELGQVDESVAVSSRLIEQYPASRHVDELLFRRGEYHFVRRKFMDAESSYAQIVARGPGSEYYELALYKLGWSFYKQTMLEEALKSYVKLLDHKVASGYDFGQVEDEADAQRVSDTYRVTSLCFSELGGAEAVRSFFAEEGARPYEDRIYRQLGEFYLEKLRYADAAGAYETFVDLYSFHARSPLFSVRVVEIYEAGDFPQLVLEAKESFVTRYAVTSAYWNHFDLAAETEVVGHLKQNLDDLAQHYHARFQQAEDEEIRARDFERSGRWYRDYLDSFRSDPGTPAIHARFADLVLEYDRFDEAADQYEAVAYDYPPHAAAATAGYAAVFARREALERSKETEVEESRERVVVSSLRFGEVFPEHPHAAAVLAAAVEDLYVLGDHDQAIEVGRGMLDRYPSTEPRIRRNAWLTVAHASFDSDRFAEAEEAYVNARDLSEEEATRVEITDNLAAAVYKQAEQARAGGDIRLAADHFLRVADVAPMSAISAVAEYDAAAALIELEDWLSAAGVLEEFRAAHPGHDLVFEATRQVAFVYESAGETARAATEYERVAEEAESPDLRRESLLHAGVLHEEAENSEQALAVYSIYVTEFTHPIDVSVATRFKMAEIHDRAGDQASRFDQLRAIVEVDASEISRRTPVVRSYAARSALILVEPSFVDFAAIELTLPFDRSLRRKREQMARVLSKFESLVDYGVGEVTAGATYYIAETYDEFSRALRESERPSDLDNDERLEYDDVLEEEAFPFEERAISVHEKNLELVSVGVWSEWIEKSLSRLAERSPGRFARREASAGPIEAIDRYVYRSPGRMMDPDPIDETLETTEIGEEQELNAEMAVSTVEPPAVVSVPPAAMAPFDEAAFGPTEGVWEDGR